MATRLKFLSTATLLLAISFANCYQPVSAQADKVALDNMDPAPNITPVPLNSVQSPNPSSTTITSPPAESTQGQAPLIAPPMSFLDLNSGRFGKLDIDLQDGQFLDAAVDKLHLTATDLDLKSGVLKSLSIDTIGGHFKNFVFDQFSLHTQGDLNFDTSKLLNEKVLQFNTPAEATVTAIVGQTTLNTFINSPTILQRLSVTANKKVAMLASMFGANVSNFGVTISEPSVVLLKDNRVSINTKANVGMNGMGMPLALELNGKLGLDNGWFAVSDTHLNTNGQEISPQLSETLVKNINGLASLGTKSDDIQFSFTELKVIPNKQFILKGTAKINRLRFGQKLAEVSK